MGLRLSADEAWEVLEAAHTGILTTLRRDGMPIATPVWFVALDRTICVGTPSGTKKLLRARHDPRASFLVESGERWADLLAVHLTGRIEQVEDPAEIERIAKAVEEKYAAFRSDATALPDRTRAHYAERTYLRLVPDERILTWDNARIAGVP